MFDKFRAALLLAVGAMAVVDDNCCTVYEEAWYKGKSVTLCYDSQDYPSYYNMYDYDFEAYKSIECGQEIEWKFCTPVCSGAYCDSSILSNGNLDVPIYKKWVIVNYTVLPSH